MVCTRAVVSSAWSAASQSACPTCTHVQTLQDKVQPASLLVKTLMLPADQQGAASESAWQISVNMSQNKQQDWSTTMEHDVSC